MPLAAFYDQSCSVDSTEACSLSLDNQSLASIKQLVPHCYPTLPSTMGQRGWHDGSIEMFRNSESRD